MNKNSEISFQRAPTSAESCQRRLHNLRTIFRPRCRNTDLKSTYHHPHLLFQYRLAEGAICPLRMHIQTYWAGWFVSVHFYAHPPITDLNSTGRHSIKYLLCSSVSPPVILTWAQLGNSQILGWLLAWGLPPSSHFLGDFQLHGQPQRQILL